MILLMSLPLGKTPVTMPVTSTVRIIGSNKSAIPADRTTRLAKPDKKKQKDDDADPPDHRVHAFNTSVAVSLRVDVTRDFNRL
jgi:hypothetical protein